MRVAFWSIWAIPLFDAADSATVGGAEVQVFLLSTGLAALGVETHVVTRSRTRERVFTHQGVVVHAVQMPGRGPAARARFGRRLLSTLQRIGADINIQRSAGYETWMVAWASRRNGQRFAFLSANSIDVAGQVVGRSMLQEFLYRRGARSADLLVVQNEEQQRGFRSHWGLDGEVLPSACLPPQSGVAPQQRDGTVLWMARCASYKNPDKAIALARRCPEIRFVMVMPRGVDSGYDAQIRAEANATPNIELHEGVPLRQTTAFFQRASVHINTAEFEGFPNTFMQAGAAGVPIVSLNVDPSGVLAAEGMGICAGGDLGRMAGELQGLVAEDGRRSEMGERARAYVARNHGRDQVVARFKTMLERAIDSPAN